MRKNVTVKRTKDYFDIDIDASVNKAFEESRYIDDGIYNVTGIKSVLIDFDTEDDIRKFIAKHQNFYVASAYETECTILLSKKPKRATSVQIGSGFNYGSTTIIKNCPKDLLILAQND